MEHRIDENWYQLQKLDAFIYHYKKKSTWSLPPVFRSLSLSKSRFPYLWKSEHTVKVNYNIYNSIYYILYFSKIVNEFNKAKNFRIIINVPVYHQVKHISQSHSLHSLLGIYFVNACYLSQNYSEKAQSQNYRSKKVRKITETMLSKHHQCRSSFHNHPPRQPFSLHFYILSW